MSRQKVAILIIGPTGGREHGMGRWLAGSKFALGEGHCHVVPDNNPGLIQDGWIPHPMPDGGVEGIANLAAEIAAREEGPLLTVVGPEDPLAAGIVNEFQERDLTIVGPTKAGAQVEASKVCALDLMHRYGIPTGRFRAFMVNTTRGFAEAEQYARFVCDWEGRVVIKPDGLTAGKGVQICTHPDQVPEAIRTVMKYDENRPVIVMQHLGDGQELSAIGLVDKKWHVALFPASQDHKRAWDGDQGPNTGGMGAYAPVVFADQGLMDEIRSRIFEPMVRAMAEHGMPFAGFLYAGLMMVGDRPHVVEWNCRLGDPEAQVILPLTATDPVELLLAAEEGQLDKVRMEFRRGAAACVVVASGTYPTKPDSGWPNHPISGIEEAEAMEGVSVFHAGTRRTADGQSVTNGGRVLDVVAHKEDLATAIEYATAAAGCIKFQDARYRHDIGAKALIAATH